MKHLSLLLIVCVVFTACGPKYTASFQKSSKFHDSAPQVAQVNESADEIDESEITPEITETLVHSDLSTSNEEILGDNEPELIVSTKGKTTTEKLPEIEELIEKYKSVEQGIVEKNLDPKIEKKEIRTAQKQLKKDLKHEVKELRKSNDDDYVLMMILALLIPPLGVGLTYGITTEFWISLLLTLLFFIPGAIYSLIMVHKHYKG